MTHATRPPDEADMWGDFHRSRPDEVFQMAYYRFIARRLKRSRSVAKSRPGR